MWCSFIDLFDAKAKKKKQKKSPGTIRNHILKKNIYNQYMCIEGHRNTSSHEYILKGVQKYFFFVLSIWKEYWIYFSAATVYHRFDNFRVRLADELSRHCRIENSSVWNLSLLSHASLFLCYLLAVTVMGWNSFKAILWIWIGKKNGLNNWVAVTTVAM